MLSHETPRKVLVIDIGGTHIKVYAKGRRQPIKIDSGPAMTPKKMIKAVHTAVDGWRHDVVSLGYPGPVVHGKPLHNPVNLGAGWVGFDFQEAFGFHPAPDPQERQTAETEGWILAVV
jgi:predicted NBD/HSP70 family sugar kinase